MGTLYAQGSDVGEFPNSTTSDNSTEFERSGSTVTSITNNTSDTASSEASNTLRVEGSSAGSPYQKYQVGAVTSFSAGLDNTDDDRYKINRDPSGSVSPTTGTNLFSMGLDDAFYDLDSLLVNHDRPGTCTQIGVINTDTTDDPDSCARLVCRTTSEVADAYTIFDVTLAAAPGSHSWKVGSSGGNSGAFEFRNFVNGGVSALAGTLRLNIAQGGQVTFPTTPCFLAFLSASDTNVTGAGALYSIAYDAEVFDQGSNFDTATGVFTAPVTGRYSFQWGVQLQDLGAANTNSICRVQTSNRRILTSQASIGTARTSLNAYHMMGSCITDMDAADTATIDVIVFNGAGNTVDVGGEGTGLFMITFFSGKLAA